MKPTIRDGTLRGGFAAVVRLLILGAAGVSGYLLSVSLSGGNAVGCGPGSACDEVLQSRWAYVLDIPVSALALAIDLALLFTTFACGPQSTPRQRRGAWEIIVPCSVLVLGAALWFVALQAFVLHRFCPWCMTAHACGALAATLLLARVPVTHGAERRDKLPAVPRSTVLKFAIGALVAVALLGIAQTFVPRKSYSVSTVPTVGASAAVDSVFIGVRRTNAPPAVAASAVRTNASPAIAPSPKTNTVSAGVPSGKIFDVLGGRFHLDVARVPLWGSPDAPLKLLSLFDYTCHHCQEMHERVVEVQRSFGNKLAVVSLPMPLDARCNPLMRGTPPPHMNACDYARIGLAVWRAKPDALAPFDDWLFGASTWQPPARRPPPLAEVRDKAMALVGMMPFEAASRDAWIEQQLRTDIDIYSVSAREFRNSAMPQFMIGTNIVSGILTVDQLRAVIAPYAEAVK
jgi:uncharacterized membrane protein